MGVSLERVQFKFASIVGELCSEPDVLSQFAVWLDLRLAEYKLKGAISLDCSGEEPDPTWLKGLSKQKTPLRVNSQTDRRAQGHSPAAYRSPSLHRPAHSSSDSDIPLSQSHSVPSGELAERLSPDIVVVKEEPQDIFPIALHENASGVTSTGHKRSAAESSLGSHWSKSSSPSQSKMRRLSSKESSSNQSLMTVIGDYSANDHDVQESDTMGDNSLSGPSSSGHNMSAPLSKSADYSADQSTDLSDSALSNDQFLQEMRWSGHSSSTGGETGPSNSNVSSVEPIKGRAESCVDYNVVLVHSSPGDHARRKSRIVSADRLPKQTLSNMLSGAGTFERWLWNQPGTERQNIVDMSPDQLDQYLADFFTTVTRTPGLDYKVESFQALKVNIDRYFKEAHYPESLKTSPLFARSRAAYSRRRRHLALSQSNQAALHYSVSMPPGLGQVNVLLGPQGTDNLN
ncbi:uncharacterized protein LOC135463662 isoform X1 [Liolophura sinensis]|uniref:uncharacterized protein LOC135463662 isoform X1 n=1 Tax=Liolophura sinensis TaxID=3198878 RepID=UPI003158A1E1